MKIKIFDTNIQSGGCGCSCSCNSAPEYSRDDLINDLKAKQKAVDIKTIIVENKSKDDLVNELNEIFKVNNEKLAVNNNTLDFTLSKILPLIVVDNSIRCIKSIPSIDELLVAIDKNTRVKMKSSCC